MKNIIILLLFVSTVCVGQIKDFFKYSKFYASMTTGTSFVEREDYRANPHHLLQRMEQNQATP